MVFIFLALFFLLFASLILVLKPNLIFLLFSLEIILLSVNVNFIFGSLLNGDYLGKYIALMLFSIAALDTSLGLVIILNYYNYHFLFNYIPSKVNIKAFSFLPFLFLFSGDTTVPFLHLAISDEVFAIRVVFVIFVVGAIIVNMINEIKKDKDKDEDEDED